MNPLDSPQPIPDSGAELQSEADVFPSLADRAIVLTGPTASGKSSVAVELAKLIDAEILSLDSIAVYQSMDIGTAKPTPADQARVPHHLIDLVPPSEDFSVARYLRAAHAKVADLESRGKRVIFVGGTPMFLKGVLRGFDPGPPADWEFRRAVEADIKQFGSEALYTRLRQVDPLAAHRIGPHDTRRMTRALEVARHTGIPLSHQQTQFDRALPADQCSVFAMKWQRSLLHQRINQRVDQMFADGLVAEIRGLITRYETLSRTAAQAVGYREVIPHATAFADQDDSPEASKSLATAREQVATHTRQLAKRQETWMRSFSEITPIDADADIDPQAVAAQIANRIKQPGE